MSSFLISKNESGCAACGACVQRCPFHAIALKEDHDGFVYPTIAKKHCISCGACQKVCPIDSPRLVFNDGDKGTAVIGFIKDDAVRLASSSGGFFTGIVEALWEPGMVVFGAEQQSDLSVRHVGVDRLEDLGRIRKSKYALSDTCDTFQEVKELLCKGKRVIYSGTPCQIAGLKMFLGSVNIDNLFTIDLACHGYFTPKFLRKEQSFLEARFRSKATGFEYRNKDGGHWRGFIGIWHFSNGKSYAYKVNRLPYLRIWEKNIISRPSCFACRFVSGNRVADVTLSDYWQVQDGSPMAERNLGTSCVLVNSVKGKGVIEKVLSSGRYKWEFIDRAYIVGKKIGFGVRIAADSRYNEAMSDLDRLTYPEYVLKWMGEPWRDNLYLKIRHFLGRIRRRVGRMLTEKGQ